MEVINVNNRQVVKCVHCDGDGVCKHSLQYYEEFWDGVWENGHHRNKYKVWRKCQMCGEAPVRISDTSGGWCEAPFCSICGGKGYTVV